MTGTLFETLRGIGSRPAVFSEYTIETLWNDPHISGRMLSHHLDGAVDVSSYRTEFIERSVRWLADAHGVGTGTRLLDLGCGPGLYTRRLAALGADVTGVDLSERSIAHARRSADRTGTPVTYLLGNYLDVPIPGTFDIAIMVMRDFCALSPAQRGRLLGRLTASLRPGGRFVFDVESVPGLRARAEGVTYAPNLMAGFWSAEPYFGFHTTFVYQDERVTLDRYDIVEEHRTRTVYNWLQHFDPPALRAELARAGLSVETVIGDLTGAPFDPDAPTFAAVATPHPRS